MVNKDDPATEKRDRGKEKANGEVALPIRIAIQPEIVPGPGAG